MSGRYPADIVHKRVDYIQYVYQNTDRHPGYFERLPFPVAVYDIVGTIIRANRVFRNITGTTEDDIRNEKANIFDLIDKKNAWFFTKAAFGAFDGSEKVYENIGPALTPCDDVAARLVAKFPHAIFFPMAYDREGVRHAAVLLDKNDKAPEMPEKYENIKDAE